MSEGRPHIELGIKWGIYFTSAFLICVCMEYRKDNLVIHCTMYSVHHTFLLIGANFQFSEHRFSRGNNFSARHNISPLWNRRTRQIFGNVVKYFYQDLGGSSFLRRLVSALSNSLFFMSNHIMTSSNEAADINPKNLKPGFQTQQFYILVPDISLVTYCKR